MFVCDMSTMIHMARAAAQEAEVVLRGARVDWEVTREVTAVVVDMAAAAKVLAEMVVATEAEAASQASLRAH